MSFDWDVRQVAHSSRQQKQEQQQEQQGCRQQQQQVAGSSSLCVFGVAFASLDLCACESCGWLVYTLIGVSFWIGLCVSGPLRLGVHLRYSRSLLFFLCRRMRRLGIIGPPIKNFWELRPWGTMELRCGPSMDGFRVGVGSIAGRPALASERHHV